MDKYFTVIVIPEKESGEKTFRIPKVAFRMGIFTLIILGILFVILAFDYLNIIKQVYQNRHLNLENRQLKEQVQLFQMKLNSINQNIERVKLFETKLKILSGLTKTNLTIPLEKNNFSNENIQKENIKNSDSQKNEKSQDNENKNKKVNDTTSFKDKLQNYKEDDLYKNLLKLYEQKIAHNIGFNSKITLAREWSNLTWKSLKLANKFAYFDYNFKLLSNELFKLENSLNHIDSHLLDRRSFINSTPTLLPAKGWITSYYGPRISPITKKLRMHEGIDIGARPGTNIVASADGKVVFAGIKPGFGHFVHIDHGYGIESFYAHAKKVLVKSGLNVKRGTVVARVGNTGYSTGPHLHYEIRVNGTPVDPLYYVLN